MNKRTKYLATLFLIGFLGTHAYASENRPVLSYILFPTIPNESSPENSLTGDGAQSVNTRAGGYFTPYLNGESQEEIISDYNEANSDEYSDELARGIPAYTYSSDNIDNQISILTVTHDLRVRYSTIKENLHSPKAIYILKNNKVIGYSILDTIPIYNYGLDSFVRSIIKLKKTDQKYPFRSKIENYKNKKLDIYVSNQSTTMIERYAIMHVQINIKDLREVDLSDINIAEISFYPIQYDSIIAPRIALALNNNLEKYGAMIGTAEGYINSDDIFTGS